MVEQDPSRTRMGSAVLDIGEDVGALVIYTGPELRSREFEVSPKDRDAYRVHTAVLERLVNGRSLFAALFLALPSGQYLIWCKSPAANEVTVAGGQVAELDWRGMEVTLFPKGYTYEPNNTSQQQAPVPLEDLPPRYHQGRPISNAPMGSAPMRYDEAGQVAWDAMWTDFCDLALAGGPRHRDTLLGPVAPDEALAAPEGYERVVAEIERGLRLVTGLPIVRSACPGWIGVHCAGERMATWLARAIEVENVCVRREGVVLYLPAGPSFRLDKEIKNVVTVVAKTHHYWMEHVTWS